VSLEYAIWYALIGAEATLLGVLLFRRVWRTLPIFCLYLAWDLTANLGTYIVNRYFPSSYFSVYFAGTIIDSVLQFSVLVELTWSVLRPLRASLSRVALWVLAALVLAVGGIIWPFAALPGLEHVSHQGLLLAQLQQTIVILRILFFLVLAGASQLLSIGWRDRELQVATGLGLYSVVSLAVAALHMHQTTASQYVHLSQIAVGSYVCCLLYWTVSLAQKEAERREFTPQMQRFLLAVAGAARSTRIALNDSHSTKSGKPGRR
jgi:hypothetical protein